MRGNGNKGVVVVLSVCDGEVRVVWWLRISDFPSHSRMLSSDLMSLDFLNEASDVLVDKLVMMDHYCCHRVIFKHVADFDSEVFDELPEFTWSSHEGGCGVGHFDTQGSVRSSG